MPEQTKKYSERVLVVNKEKYLAQDNTSITDFVSEHGQWLDRNIAEENDNFLQIIPYIAVVYKRRIFQYKRINKSNEKRLLNYNSIGVGGHVDDTMGLPIDNDIVQKAALIELQEEIFITSSDQEVAVNQEDIHWLGCHYDPSVPVGKSHLAVFGILDLSGQDNLQFSIKETHKLEGDLVKFSKIDNDNLEHWSKKLLSCLIPAQHDILLSAKEEGNNFILRDMVHVDSQVYTLYKSSETGTQYLVHNSDKEVLCYEATDDMLLIFNHEEI